MLRGGIWRNRGRFNRALSFRAGQTRAYARDPNSTSPSSSSSQPTQGGNTTPAERSASWTPSNGQKAADGALPWQTSAAAPSTSSTGSPAGAKGWGGGWGASSPIARPEGPGAQSPDLLLPHERAAREEAARRTATAAAAAAAAPAEQAKTQGISRTGHPRLGKMPNITPQSPRIAPVRRPTGDHGEHRPPPRPMRGHDSHRPHALPPLGPRHLPPKRSPFRADDQARRSNGPFAFMKGEIDASDSLGDTQSPPQAQRGGAENGELDSAAGIGGDGEGNRPEWGHLRRRAPVLSSHARMNLDSLLSEPTRSRDDRSRKSFAIPKDWSKPTRSPAEQGGGGLDSLLSGASASRGARRPATRPRRERPQTQAPGADNQDSPFSDLGQAPEGGASKPSVLRKAEAEDEVSGDPWAKVEENLTLKKNKSSAEEEESDSGSWDWVDNFETNRRARARDQEGTGIEKDIIPRQPVIAPHFEDERGGGAWKRDRGHGSRYNTDRGLDRGDRRGGSQKSKGRRRRNDDAEDEDFDDDLVQDRRRRKAEKKAQREREAQLAAEQAGPTPILLPEFISVSNLAVALGVKQDQFLQQLEELGFENISQESIMTGETAALVAQEYGFEPSVDVGEGVDLKPRPPPADPSTLPPRPPVVTIMGHVDHGKTTLLDYLRKSSVAAQEHGGITQHIGAFSVKMSSGKQITFLDTPGHAAFLTMRQRGAHVTDIVILVVAADDSVKPQTIEALKHARASKVPIIVAINKVDKDEARIDLVKSDLAKNGVEIEDYGGDVQVVCVSGKTGLGMSDLEENIITLSEILDMRAETDGMAEGWVLESSVKPIGRVATVLVKRGTLRTGDCIVAGKVWGKVRVLRNEAGAEISEAPPGTPVEVLGWRELPDAGDQVLQAPDEGKAKDAAHYRIENSEREKVVAEMTRAEQEKRERERAAADAEGEEGSAEAGAEAETGTKIVNFVVKGDVHGSVEAVCASVEEIGNNEVRPRILRSSPGQITESDVEHAATSSSLIINFNNPIPSHIKGMADLASVKILDHNIIYHLTDDIRANLSEHLAPLLSTRVLGEAEVLQVFPINVKGRVFKNIAGCRVRNGQVSRNAKYRVMRRGEKIFEGDIETLKHGKKEMPEIRKGSECGISFVDWDDFSQGDQIQAFEEISTKRHL